MNYFKGKLKQVSEIETVGNNFTKRYFIVDECNDKYPNVLKFELLGDRVHKIDNFRKDNYILVEYKVKGKEYKDNIFHTLECLEVFSATQYYSEKKQNSKSDNLPF